MLAVTLAVLVITAAYVLNMKSSDYGLPAERFLNFIEEEAPESATAVGLAEFRQGLPLSDVFTVRTGVTRLDAPGCAAADAARQTELGGQYVQRTNNYRRDYPDDCSSLLSDFVGGFYEPKVGGVGLGVPCAGSC